MNKEREQVNIWLKNLSSVFNCPEPLALGADGVCAIQHAGLVYIVEVPLNNSFIVYIYAAIQPLTGNEMIDYGLLEKAMLLNQFNEKTQGGVLSLSPELNSIICTFKEPIETFDEQKFIKTFKICVTTTIALRKHFSQEFID